MPTVQLSAAASTIMVASYVIIMFLAVVLLAAIAYVLLKLNATLEAYRATIDPLAEQTRSILEFANSKLSTIGEKTEAILSQGECTAEVVHEKVEKTATMVQRTVNAPLIGLNALTAGVSRAVRTFGNLQREQTEPVEVVTKLDDPMNGVRSAPSVVGGPTEFGIGHNNERLRSNV